MDVHPLRAATEPAHRRRGLTLSELLLSLALVAILASLGMPSFLALYRTNVISNATSTLFNHLLYTRSEALKRNSPGVICRSANRTDCLGSSSSRTDWSTGWIVFINVDDDKMRDASEPVIRVGHVADGISLRYNQWWRVIFRPDGSASNGTFTLCDRYGNSRQIVVYRSGRVRAAASDAAQYADLCPPS